MHAATQGASGANKEPNAPLFYRLRGCTIALVSGMVSVTVAVGVIGAREKKEAHSSGSTLHFSRRPEKGEPPRRALRPAFIPDESVSHGHCPYDSRRAYSHACTHVPRAEWPGHPWIV